MTLEKQPVLTEQDIDSYQISPNNGHFIWLKPGLKVRVGPVDGNALMDRPFVVVADGYRIYMGDFHASLSSSFPRRAFIELPLFRPGKAAELQGVVEIGRGPIMDITGNTLFKDMRADPRILKVLQDIGKLNKTPEGWDEPHPGVKLRLVTEKPKWKQQEEPRFRVEILNTGNRALYQDTCLLDIDGRGVEYAGGMNPDPINPGDRRERIVVLKPELWRLHGKPLYLKTGRHYVRVMCDFRTQYFHLRPFSNKVNIQIVTAHSNSSEPNGVE